MNTHCADTPAPLRRWQDITPEQAASEQLDLSARLDITAPLNELGERCPWPWDPQQLKGQPIGQYHCPACGAMVLAGVEHLDYVDYDKLTGPLDVTAAGVFDGDVYRFIPPLIHPQVGRLDELDFTQVELPEGATREEVINRLLNPPVGTITYALEELDELFDVPPER